MTSISTDRIERIAESAARAAVKASGEIKLPHDDCDKESRIMKLESIADEQERELSAVRKKASDLEGITSNHSVQLSEAQKQSIRLENGLNNVAEKVGVHNSIFVWVGGAIGVGLLGIAGSCLVYVIALMGHKP